MRWLRFSSNASTLLGAYLAGGFFVAVVEGKVDVELLAELVDLWEVLRQRLPGESFDAEVATEFECFSQTIGIAGEFTDVIGEQAEARGVEREADLPLGVAVQASAGCHVAEAWLCLACRSS